MSPCARAVAEASRGITATIALIGLRVIDPVSRRFLVMSRLVVALAASTLAASFEAPAGTLEVAVLDSAGHPVADAAIHAVPAGAPPQEARARTARIEQVDREFLPFVSV